MIAVPAPKLIGSGPSAGPRGLVITHTHESEVLKR